MVLGGGGGGGGLGVGLGVGEDGRGVGVGVGSGGVRKGSGLRLVARGVPNSKREESK